VEKDAKIYIAGHRGMVGSAIVRKLKSEGFENLLFRTSSELDLRNQAAVEDFFATEKPDYVFLAAAKVGGIVANNTYRADFLYENLLIEANIIHNAYVTGVKNCCFWVHPVFTRNWLRSRSRKTIC
jgi:GDP-L-fucose synthase